MEHKFQINLRGIIELLSDHLYSQPQVFIRELLQNGTDAIRARDGNSHDFQGEISFELFNSNTAATLLVKDNGIGLTEAEMHRFLATIGESSKRVAKGKQPKDFIGQFGIGLLSCFVVSDEIVVISRSARESSPAVEWRGRPDGTYSVKTLDRDLQPGTHVYLTVRPEHRKLFELRQVVEIAKHYGQYLPYPIKISESEQSFHINADPPPWKIQFSSKRAERSELLAYGKQCFGQSFFDAIPLQSSYGGLEGVAFILPYSQSLKGQRSHRVYLKNMLLSERVENLLPDWAFFVKAVVNANDLRPTASRESFYEDDRLIQTRTELGELLKDYLRDLAEMNPREFEKLLTIHDVSMKALALEDDEFFKVLIDYLPLETTLGEMKFGELKDQPVIQYVARVDQYKQVSRIAAAQGICVVNAGYVYLTELLDRYQELFADVQIQRIDPSDLTETFTELTPTESDAIERLVDTIREVLIPWECEVSARHFQPVEIPALYSIDLEGTFFRSIRQTQEITAPLWSDLLEGLASERKSTRHAELCLNYNNPLIRQLTKVSDAGILRSAAEIIYIQSLLMGQHPLSNKELKLLNSSLLGWLEWGLKLSQSGEEK